MKIKLLLLGGLAVAMASCSDDTLTNGNNSGNGGSESPLSTASYLSGQWGQTRAGNIDTWSSQEHANHDWMSFSFELPSNPIDITDSNFDANGSVFYVPASYSGTLDLNWKNIPSNASIYVLGDVKDILNANFGDNIKVYNSGKLNFGPQSGSIDIYNNNELTLYSYANIKNVYNYAELTMERSRSPWWDDPNSKADLHTSMTVHGNGGSIEMPDGVSNFKAAFDVHNSTVYINGDVEFQNDGTNKYMCGLVVTGTLRMVAGANLTTSYVKANELTIQSTQMRLLPDGYVETGRFSMTGNGVSVVGYDNSKALINSSSWNLENLNSFSDSFSSNIYFKATGNITVNELIQRDNGNGGFSNSNETNTYATVEDYLQSQNGSLVADRFNQEISGTPECGDPYGEPGEGDEPEESGLVLIPIGIIDAPGHDHNEDKTPDNRLLSATCIDYDGTTFYVSYHMRGGNYAGDTYDNDDVEGCIETWTLQDNEMNQTEIVLGKYMWSYDFDFNHIIIDGNNIVTVGHKGNKGAIIGRLPNTFANFNPSYEPGEPTTSSDFWYKYLTTEEKLYGDYENESGNVTNQFIDYKNAGDGNCVIKVGNEYYVAAYGGYGKLDSNFNRIMDENDAVAFVSTDGSAKHIIEKGGNEVAVLYLNERPTTLATAQSSASIATIDKNTFPFQPSVTTVNGMISPIDGKNVLAWDGSNMYACLGRGGLSINNTDPIKFGEDNNEPVNGVAVDDEYIYVATGSHVRVLDINSKQELANYPIPYMSANYIKVVRHNGQKYVVVAFGQAGVRVFRLEWK